MIAASSGPKLRDIHPPPPPSWWPPAPGWWLLAGLVLVVLVLLAWWWRRRGMQRRRRQQAYAELDHLLDAYRQHQDAAALAGGLSQLLRRVGRLHDAAAAADAGERWQALLARFAGDSGQVETLAALDTAMYRRHAELDVEASVDAVRQWLRRALRQRGAS